MAKNEVAKSAPHPDLLSIRNKLLYSFKEKVTSNIILGLWRRLLNVAKEYRDMDDNVKLVETDSDDNKSQNFDEDEDF